MQEQDLASAKTSEHIAALTTDLENLKMSCHATEGKFAALAAAIDMIAAGTSAPTAIAAKQNPTNHEGNIFTNSAGTT